MSACPACGALKLAEQPCPRCHDNMSTHWEECWRAHLACAVREVEWAREEIVRLDSENTALRGLIAQQDTPCVYCGAATMAECPRGFPGCAQADDLMVLDEQRDRQLAQALEALRGTICSRATAGAPECGTDETADARLGICPRCAVLNRSRA